MVGGLNGAASCWFLLGAGTGPDSEERLGALERSNDGFELAEVDLELRGEGTILGARQKGAPDLKLASLRRDKELVAVARRVAFDLVDGDPALDGLPELRDEIRLLLDEEDRTILFKSCPEGLFKSCPEGKKDGTVCSWQAESTGRGAPCHSYGCSVIGCGEAGDCSVQPEPVLEVRGILPRRDDL